MKIIALSLCLLVLSSCSTNWKDFFDSGENTQKRNEELLKDFKVDKDLEQKFKEPVKKNVKKKTVVKKTNISKKIAKKKKNNKKEKKIHKKVVVAKKEYPEGYPDELKILNKEIKTIREHFRPVFNPGEKAIVDINYLGVSTGKIVLSTMEDTQIGGDEVYHINAKVRTARFYRYLYELDDKVDSYISKESLTPLKFSLIQRESKKNIDDLQLFDKEAKKVFSFYKKVKKGKVTKRKKENYTPDFFQDPLSLIYFIRGLNFNKIKSFDIPFFNKGVLKHFRVSYGGEELIDTNIGKIKAYKILASSKHSGETIKGGNMHFWFSKDSRRIFLKFKAKITIGSISGDIEKYSSK